MLITQKPTQMDHWLQRKKKAFRLRKILKIMRQVTEEKEEFYTTYPTKDLYLEHINNSQNSKKIANILI